MRWLTGTALAIAGVVALSGCGGGSASVQPPSPTPTPTPSAASITINSLSPNTATAGSADLILTMTGTNLDLQHTGSLQETHTFAIWSVGNSQTSLTATVVSSTQVTAVVPSALLAAVVNAQISVQKWYKADDAPFAVSNSLVFTVTTGPAPSVVPAADVLGTNGTRQFAATGFDDGSKVTWSIEEGQTGGTITPNGFYTAPDHSGTFHIVVTSPSTPSTTASASVTVTSSGFVPTETMHVARTGHTATLLKDGKVLIVGGGDVTAELFDPASGTFSFTGAPMMGRLGATATLLSDGRVLIAGGLGLTAGPDGHLPLLNTAEVFDPTTGTFSPTGTMVQARQQHIATLLSDGRVLIAGGYFDYICFTASAELFDPVTGTFSPTGFMLSERVGHTATLLASGEVLVVGGSNGCAPDSADDPPWDPLFAELYEPNSGSFQGAGIMSTTRIHHAAVRLTNGKVLVLGGIPSLQNLHEQPPNPSYAEVYDRVADSFSPITGLTISPARYTATLMNSGMVLIVGGAAVGDTPTTEVQLLDPTSGVLTPTGALGTARVGHAATLLQDGHVLVTGGTDANGNALASAELYK
jgi:hypothetical protein